MPVLINMNGMILLASLMLALTACAAADLIPSGYGNGSYTYGDSEYRGDGSDNG